MWVITGMKDGEMVVMVMLGGRMVMGGLEYFCNQHHVNTQCACVAISFVCLQSQ
jgi:hypothetical protein